MHTSSTLSSVSRGGAKCSQSLLPVVRHFETLNGVCSELRRRLAAGKAAYPIPLFLPLKLVELLVTSCDSSDKNQLHNALVAAQVWSRVCRQSLQAAQGIHLQSGTTEHTALSVAGKRLELVKCPESRGHRLGPDLLSCNALHPAFPLSR